MFRDDIVGNLVIKVEYSGLKTTRCFPLNIDYIDACDAIDVIVLQMIHELKQVFSTLKLPRSERNFE